MFALSAQPCAHRRGPMVLIHVDIHVDPAGAQIDIGGDADLGHAVYVSHFVLVTQNRGDGVNARPHIPRRGDIQGLRAIAVLLVVIYHYLPQYIPGGFVGVDVFFVISGFLISTLLFRELEQTGTIRLSAFYARRVRRLMPAAVTTMAVTVGVSVFVVGPIRLAGILQDMAWTSVYLANVRFAQSPDGYFASGDQSPLLHFWSLAVEEQYYLIWPVILLAVATATRSWRRLMVPLLVTVLTGSLAISVAWTYSQSANGYYSLAARAWELAIGGALALAICRRVTLPARLAVIFGWVGLAMVLYAAFRYDALTPFPGWTAAVPTVGTAMMIWAGSFSRHGPLQRLLSVRPAQFLGNISYSLYLWHWPVFILGVEVIGRAPGRRLLVLLMGVALVLATVSYYVAEQSTGRWRRAARPRRVVTAGLAIAVAASAIPAVAAVAVPTSSGVVISGAATPEELTLASATSPVRFATSGPGPMPAAVPANVTPALQDLDKDLAQVFTNGCFDAPAAAAATLPACQGGDPNGKTRVVLTGDSIAGAWWPAVNAAAKANGWKLFMIGKNSCPLADVRITQGFTATLWPECDAWQVAAPKVIANLHPDLIIWAAYSGYRSKVSLKEHYSTLWPAGVAATMRQLTAVSRVLFMGATPTLVAQPAKCLSEHMGDIAQCSSPLDRAVAPATRAMNQKLAAGAGAVYFDPTQLLCTPVVCPVMSSNVVMYRDFAHLTATYSSRLADHLAVVIQAAL